MSRGIFVKDKDAKAGDLIFPWICGLIGVALVFVAQFAGILGVILAGLDYQKYEGLYLFSYGIIAIIILPIFCRICGKFYSDHNSGVRIYRPDTTDVFLVIAFSFGLLGLVSLYMTATTFLADYLNNVKEGLDEYSRNITRYNEEVTPEEVALWDKILDYVASGLIIPIVEEILFRGVILGQFKKAYSAWFSVAISAIVFGLVHGIGVHIGYALICGILIGVIYCLTDNLILTCIIHICFNFFGAVLLNILTESGLNIAEETANNIIAFIGSFEIYMLPAMVVVIIIFALRRRRMNANIKASSINMTGGTRNADIDFNDAVFRDDDSDRKEDHRDDDEDDEDDGGIHFIFK